MEWAMVQIDYLMKTVTTDTLQYKRWQNIIHCTNTYNRHSTSTQGFSDVLRPVPTYHLPSIWLKTNYFDRLLRFFLQQVTNILQQYNDVKCLLTQSLAGSVSLNTVSQSIMCLDIGTKLLYFVTFNTMSSNNTCMCIQPPFKSQFFT